ncbi:DNA internalization-related competence protein ComEC/Rec2 [Chitinimonas sp. BJB300]|uniref:DNA internalization-related competence protein ComEC/Rec2 n=1 Tax=Chitinimonas sp. BJB300 TaxID=1559339 RepID=UPI000C0F9532|nr:DNA internalization-related competence protein ComEC/Rec2 [Chitinimonas sp. BJB300]PHV10949.1 DNA internalization-related competence protein ComEC/Rec2 [Chitinimonas sp. BJB300]TSJ89885.1 DNA internalization-related competence protein ComEC/Rec2 [Chitinimonas sp. BJB300]
MRLVIIAFVAGVVWLQWQASLPAVWPYLLLAAAGVITACYSHTVRVVALLLAAASLGVAYTGWRAEARLAERLNPSLEGESLKITGTVVGLPQSTRYGPRFRFAPDAEQANGLPPLLLLNDYAKPGSNWQPGQRWALQVKLKQPHGNANPGGFDYEGWLLAEGIGGTGNVNKLDRRLLDEFVLRPIHVLHRLRATLVSRIQHALGARPYTGVIVALVVGEQSGISQTQWQLFRATGITHLVSISGLHITLVASLFATIFEWLWRRSRWLTTRCPARQAALLAGVLAALAYSLLAGFSVPTQRTLFMLSTSALALLSGRHLAVSTIWCAALAVCVLLDPWSVLAAGFWLSFLTVGAMLWALAGRQDQAAGWQATLQQWGAVQWAATLGSLPLLLILFQQLPLSSPLANALAIPLISAIVTPLALVGTLEPSGLLLQLAHYLLGLGCTLLMPLSHPGSIWTQAQPASWTLLPAGIAIAVLLLPRGVPGRWLGIWLLLPLAFPLLSPIAMGSFRAIAFDVGQGLSVLVQTQNHSLLFDTGPEGGGSRVVPGGLRATGVRQLDMLMLSHADSDHIGAAAAVLSEVRTLKLSGALPQQLPANLPPPPHDACLAGQQWLWDGVQFDVLHPVRNDLNSSDNGASCVLRISAATGSLLIPGDIGRVEEAGLLTQSTSVQSDVLLIPHHGSNSSSSAAFIAAVAPKLAIASNGYRNAFHHPREAVVTRYHNAGATVWRSDRDGAINLDFGPNAWSASSWRDMHPRYWQPTEATQAKRIVATTRLPLS